MLYVIAAIVAGAAPQPGAPPAERARASLSEYFSDDDYPEPSYRRGAEGVVHFRLEIDARGAPSRCLIDYSSGDIDLDRATCDILMSRARFRPARDSNGHAVPDRVSSRVRWAFPTPNPAFPSSHSGWLRRSP
jgi:periplasmic protein TonB